MKPIQIFSTTLFGLALGMAIASPLLAASTKDVVRSERDSVVQTKEGSCVRTKWMSGNDPCAPARPVPPPVPAPAPVVQMPPPVVVQAAPKPPRTVIEQSARTIYFEFNRDDLTPEAKMRLDQLADILKNAKDIQRAEIVGFADPMGSSKYNYALSERRARNVESYLHERGYINTNLSKVRALGEDSASANCAKKMKRASRIECLATDRKVEVEVVYTTLVR